MAQVGRRDYFAASGYSFVAVVRLDIEEGSHLELAVEFVAVLAEVVVGT